ncbi:MAG: phage tail tape measure protein, partial [Thermoplasmata archaeon]
MNGDLGLGIVVSMKDAFSRNAARIESSMQSLDATVAAASERMTRNLDRIQKGTMMIGAGLALLAVPAGLVASTAATQKALGELASLGVKDLQAIEDAAESFTNTWAGSTKAEFITAAYDVRSALAGLSDEAVGTFTAMAALTAKATKATTEEMVGTFTTAYGIFKPIMSEFSDVEWSRAFAGAMAQTVASFKTTGRQMADAIKNIGAVAASSNVPLQEQLAILGQLQTTMPGSEAGTLYKAFIMKAAEAGEKLGLSFVDSTGRLKGIVPILQEIKARFPDLSQAAAQVEIKKAFGSDEAVKFLLQMSQGMEALEGNIRAIERAMKGGTAVTEEMARAMNMDIGSQFTLLRQQLGNLFEILGRTLLPVVTPVIQGISRAILFFQKLARSMPGLTRVLLTLSMAFGAVLVVVGGVIAAAGTIGLMLPAIKAGLAAMGAAVAGVGSAFATYFLPVTAIIGGVVLAVYLLKRAWETNFAGIRDTVLGAWEKVKLVFQGIKALITSLSGGTGRMSAELARKLEEAGLMGLVVTVFRIYYRVREFLSGLWQAFAGAFARIRAIVEPAVRALMQAWG